MYDKIKQFCKVKNAGNVLFNTDEPTPRVSFIMNLLDENNIKYTLDKFHFMEVPMYNIIIKGTSDKMVIAHHDIVNNKSDNANDNSASVINAIALKLLRPDVNIVLTDGEENGGHGAQRLSDQINAGEFGSIKWVLNLELSGRGGKNFFIGNYPGDLLDHITNLFGCPVFNTPFNDSVILVKNGIDSVVINPLPITDKKTPIIYNDNYLDFDMLFNCHSTKDSLDTISIKDMKEFVEEVLCKII